MIMSDHDVAALLQFSIRKTAEKLNVDDVDWKTTNELLREIESVDETTHTALYEFCEAYEEWYDYIKHLDKLGKHGNLDGPDHTKLLQLERQRNTTRAAILSRLKSL